MNIGYQPLSTDDAAFRLDVFDRTIAPTVQRHSGLTLEELNRMTAEQLRGGRHRAIVADGERVGVLLVSELADSTALDQIEILPEHQGRGIGAAVIGELLAHSRASGRPVSLRVFTHNTRARALYQRLGFAERSTDGDEVFMVFEPDARDTLERPGPQLP